MVEEQGTDDSVVIARNIVNERIALIEPDLGPGGLGAGLSEIQRRAAQIPTVNLEVKSVAARSLTECDRHIAGAGGDIENAQRPRRDFGRQSVDGGPQHADAAA